MTEHLLRNFKILYGTGHFRLNEDNKPTHKSSIKYTIKDGIIFDTKALLTDVKEMIKSANNRKKTDKKALNFQ
ncbi:MAG: hypothetical protein QNK36_15875 [Colwellia sp.]|nr:hypothetical protein [Colwellia sp.]